MLVPPLCLLIFFARSVIGGRPGDGFRFAADSANVIGEVRNENFTCEGKEYGYYADQALDCKVFHICSPVASSTGRYVKTLMFSFFCPEKTLFSQDSKTCIAEKSALPCERAHTLYDLNKAIGQQNQRSSKKKHVSAAKSENDLHSQNVISSGPKTTSSGNTVHRFSSIKSPANPRTQIGNQKSFQNEQREPNKVNFKDKKEAAPKSEVKAPKELDNFNAGHERNFKQQDIQAAVLSKDSFFPKNEHVNTASKKATSLNNENNVKIHKQTNQRGTISQSNTDKNTDTKTQHSSFQSKQKTSLNSNQGTIQISNKNRNVNNGNRGTTSHIKTISQNKNKQSFNRNKQSSIVTQFPNNIKQSTNTNQQSRNINKQTITTNQKSTKSKPSENVNKQSFNTNQQSANNKQSFNTNQQSTNNKQSFNTHQQTTNNKQSFNTNQQSSNKKQSFNTNQQSSNNKQSFNTNHQSSNNKQSFNTNQRSSNNKQSFNTNQQSSNNKQSENNNRQTFNTKQQSISNHKLSSNSKHSLKTNQASRGTQKFINNGQILNTNQSPLNSNTQQTFNRNTHISTNKHTFINNNQQQSNNIKPPSKLFQTPNKNFPFNNQFEVTNFPSIGIPLQTISHVSRGNVNANFNKNNKNGQNQIPIGTPVVIQSNRQSSSFNRGTNTSPGRESNKNQQHKSTTRNKQISTTRKIQTTPKTSFFTSPTTSRPFVSTRNRNQFNLVTTSKPNKNNDEFVNEKELQDLLEDINQFAPDLKIPAVTTHGRPLRPLEFNDHKLSQPKFKTTSKAPIVSQRNTHNRFGLNVIQHFNEPAEKLMPPPPLPNFLSNIHNGQSFSSVSHTGKKNNEHVTHVKVNVKNVNVRRNPFQTNPISNVQPQTNRKNIDRNRGQQIGSTVANNNRFQTTKSVINNLSVTPRTTVPTSTGVTLPAFGRQPVPKIPFRHGTQKAKLSGVNLPIDKHNSNTVNFSQFKQTTKPFINRVSITQRPTTLKSNRATIRTFGKEIIVPEIPFKHGIQNLKPTGVNLPINNQNSNVRSFPPNRQTTLSGVTITTVRPTQQHVNDILAVTTRTTAQQNAISALTTKPANRNRGSRRFDPNSVFGARVTSRGRVNNRISVNRTPVKVTKQRIAVDQKTPVNLNEKAPVDVANQNINVNQRTPVKVTRQRTIVNQKNSANPQSRRRNSRIRSKIVRITPLPHGTVTEEPIIEKVKHFSHSPIINLSVSELESKNDRNIQAKTVGRVRKIIKSISPNVGTKQFIDSNSFRTNTQGSEQNSNTSPAISQTTEKSTLQFIESNEFRKSTNNANSRTTTVLRITKLPTTTESSLITDNEQITGASISHETGQVDSRTRNRGSRRFRGSTSRGRNRGSPINRVVKVKVLQQNDSENPTKNIQSNRRRVTSSRRVLNTVTPQNVNSRRRQPINIDPEIKSSDGTPNSRRNINKAIRTTPVKIINVPTRLPNIDQLLTSLQGSSFSVNAIDAAIRNIASIKGAQLIRRVIKKADKPKQKNSVSEAVTIPPTVAPIRVPSTRGVDKFRGRTQVRRTEIKSTPSVNSFIQPESRDTASLTVDNEQSQRKVKITRKEKVTPKLKSEVFNVLNADIGKAPKNEEFSNTLRSSRRNAHTRVSQQPPTSARRTATRTVVRKLPVTTEIPTTNNEEDNDVNSRDAALTQEITTALPLNVATTTKKQNVEELRAQNRRKSIQRGRDRFRSNRRNVVKPETHITGRKIDSTGESQLLDLKTENKVGVDLPLNLIMTSTEPTLVNTNSRSSAFRGQNRFSSNSRTNVRRRTRTRPTTQSGNENQNSDSTASFSSFFEDIIPENKNEDKKESSDSLINNSANPEILSHNKRTLRGNRRRIVKKINSSSDTQKEEELTSDDVSGLKHRVVGTSVKTSVSTHREGSQDSTLSDLELEALQALTSANGPLISNRGNPSRVRRKLVSRRKL